MNAASKAIAAELKKIADANGGLLRPSDVVAAARPKTSPLHARFEWDNSKAAQEYRLEQARRLIRVIVQIEPNGSTVPQRVWVSLNRDPEPEGYRSLVKVMSDKEMRESLLQQAMAEMEYFADKYSSLVELSNVFSAMRKAQSKIAKHQPLKMAA